MIGNLYFLQASKLIVPLVVVLSDSCDPMDCSLAGSSVYGVLEARILEWVAIPFCRGFSCSKVRTWASYFVGRFFTA